MMEQYQIISIIAGLILSHWSMYLFFRERLKVRKRNYLAAIKEATRLQQETILLRKANEELYEKGKQDVVKTIRMEMELDHEAIKFIKIPQKKSINEAGENNDHNYNDSTGRGGAILFISAN